jgi:hypothetical protein
VFTRRTLLSMTADKPNQRAEHLIEAALERRIHIRRR